MKITKNMAEKIIRRVEAALKGVPKAHQIATLSILLSRHLPATSIIKRRPDNGDLAGILFAADDLEWDRIASGRAYRQ